MSDHMDPCVPLLSHCNGTTIMFSSCTVLYLSGKPYSVCHDPRLCTLLIHRQAGLQCKHIILFQTAVGIVFAVWTGTRGLIFEPSMGPDLGLKWSCQGAVGIHPRPTLTPAQIYAQATSHPNPNTTGRFSRSRKWYGCGRFSTFSLKPRC